MEQRGGWELEVDAHVFQVTERADQPGTYDLLWVSGSDPEYGFTVAASDGKHMSHDQLRQRAAEFLAQIDGSTGYID